MPEKPFRISFESVKEIEEREKVIHEQLQVLEKQEHELKESIARLEAELRLLNDIDSYMRGEYDFVGNLE